MNQMPVMTIKICFKCKKKFAIHASTWIWMNGNIEMMGHKWLCNAYIDSHDVQFNKETCYKFLLMEKSNDPSRPPKTEWSIITLFLQFHCLPHIASYALKNLIKTLENSSIFELYEFSILVQGTSLFLRVTHLCLLQFPPI